MLQHPNQFRRKRRYDAENAAMLFARLAPKRVVDLTSHPIIAEALEPGSLIEIDGPTGSGKTSVLIDVAAQCVLSAAVGGLEINVAYVDCDRQFHVNRLTSLIGRKFERYHCINFHRVRLIDEGELTKCLERFHYVACDCSEDLLRALEQFDNVAGVSSFTSGKDGGWIVLIDAINAFYWLDRTTRTRTNVTETQQMYAHRIQRFLNEHNVAAIVTKLTIEGICEDNDQRTEKSAVSCTMDPIWRKLVNTSIQLSVAEGRTIHRAARGVSSPVTFKIMFDGISYD